MAKPDVEIVTVPVPAELSEHRFVYNGDVSRPPAQRPVRTNKPVRPRERSSFTLIFGIVVTSLLIVFYVWNKITVNHLAEEVNALQITHQKIVNNNEILRAEINQKSRLERIGKITTEQLGMTYPKEQPVWFEIDPDASRQSQQK